MMSPVINICLGPRLYLADPFRYCFSVISRWQCGVINSTRFSRSSTYWVRRSRSVLPC